MINIFFLIKKDDELTTEEMRPNHSRQSSCAKVLFDDSNYFEHKIKENELNNNSNNNNNNNTRSNINFIYQSPNKTEDNLAQHSASSKIFRKKI